MEPVQPPSDGGFDYVFKIIVIGDSGVGKSSLTLRLSEDAFFKDHASTIAIDFRMHCMDYLGKRIRLQIWDTAGQERFQSVATAFYRGANGVILCFDITQRKSFENVDIWLERVRAQALPGVACILVGCKADMNESRVVPREQAAEWALNHGMGYIETSAKDSDNVTHAFEQIVFSIIEDQKDSFRGPPRTSGTAKNISFGNGSTWNGATKKNEPTKRGCC